jgi:hypothetical protein
LKVEWLMAKLDLLDIEQSSKHGLR